jgi:hypothetical protein
MVESEIKQKPTTNFSQNILRSIVGDERAKAAFNSISLSCIPSIKDNSKSAKFSLDRKFAPT